jgi:hypothetical protein
LDERSVELVARGVATVGQEVEVDGYGLAKDFEVEGLFATKHGQHQDLAVQVFGHVAV